MSHNPEFSIIVPVYNAEKTITKCIDSIISQTINDFELILIDDGSSDRSLAICKEFEKKDTRIHVYSQDNKGPSAARNNGLKHASGNWCVFVDSDDWLKENHLEEFSKEDTDISWIGYDLYDEEGMFVLERTVKKYHSNNNEKENAIIAIMNEKQFFALTFTKKFRMDIIRKNNITFNENIRICEDILFTQSFLFYAANLSVIEKATYNYLCRKNSLSRGGTNFLQFFDFVKCYADLLSSCPYSDRLYNMLRKEVEKRVDILVETAFRPFSHISTDIKRKVVLYGLKYKYEMNNPEKYFVSKSLIISYIICYFQYFLFVPIRKIKQFLKQIRL